MIEHGNSIEHGYLDLFMFFLLEFFIRSALTVVLRNVLEISIQFFKFFKKIVFKKVLKEF
jgi:hypothetical protein